MKEIDYVLMATNTAIGIDQIESIIGIIMLSLQVVLVLYRLGYSVYKKIKNKKFQEIGEELDNAIEQIEDILDRSEDNG